jgi:enoyl-CoA hydratase/carnithine racemase
MGAMPETATEPLILTKVDGAIGWLIINRKERRNALNRDMWAAIPPAVATLVAASAVRAIVIRGAGEEAFSAGADIAEFAEARNDAAAAAAYEELNGAAFRALRTAPKPVIAMIHGYCFGGGLAIALACDLRIASEAALFSLPPARLGLAYPLDGLADLIAAVPLSTAKEIIFTARRLTAAEARQCGLVNATAPAAALDDSVRGLCAAIAEGAPLTIRAAKAALDHLAGRPGAPSRAELDALVRACFDSADYAEGRAAFLAKRKPNFTGH